MSYLGTFVYVALMMLYAALVGVAALGIISGVLWAFANFGAWGIPAACVGAGLAAVLVEIVANGP